MTIKVKNIIKSPIAAFHNEGLAVFELIERAIKTHESVVLSFIGIERCATQFLNASIGKLYLLNDPQAVDHLLSYDYGDLKNLELKIQEVKENAIHSKEYDTLIERATV